jgi:uncharacterized caspase-like protein
VDALVVLRPTGELRAIVSEQTKLPLRLVFILELNAMLRAFLGCLIAALIFVMRPPFAHAELDKRVALVIGIGDYQLTHGIVPSLPHPVSDARAVADGLTRLGFSVVTVADIGKEDLQKALDVVTKERNADIVFIYFAGHGLQIGGRSYLIPKDVVFDNAATLEATSLPLEELFKAAARVAPKRIILIDACRDLVGKEATKFEALLDDPSRPVVPGLGRIGKVDGTIYAFATEPGKTASDGAGEHSPFAAAVLAHVGTKGLTFSSVMKIVQQEVYDRSSGKQLPYIEDALPDVLFALAGTSQAGPLPERDQLLLAMADVDADTRTQVEHIASDTGVPLATLYGALLAGEATVGKSDSEARERRLQEAAKEFIFFQSQLKIKLSLDATARGRRCDKRCQLAYSQFLNGNPMLAASMLANHPDGRLQRVARAWSRYGTRFKLGDQLGENYAGGFALNKQAYVRLPNGNVRPIESFTAWDAHRGVFIEDIGDERFTFSGAGFERYSLDGRQKKLVSVSDLCGSGWYRLTIDRFGMGMVPATVSSGIIQLANPEKRQSSKEFEPEDNEELDKTINNIIKGKQRQCEPIPLPFYSTNDAYLGSQPSDPLKSVARPAIKQERELWTDLQFSSDLHPYETPEALCKLFQPTYTEQEICQKPDSNVPLDAKLVVFSENHRKIGALRDIEKLSDGVIDIDYNGSVFNDDDERIYIDGGYVLERHEYYEKSRINISYGDIICRNKRHNKHNKQGVWKCVYFTKIDVSEFINITPDGRYALMKDGRAVTDYYIIDLDEEKIYKVDLHQSFDHLFLTEQAGHLYIYQDMAAVSELIMASGRYILASRNKINALVDIGCDELREARQVDREILLVCHNGVFALISTVDFEIEWVVNISAVLSVNNASSETSFSFVVGDVLAVFDGHNAVAFDMQTGLHIAQKCYFDAAIDGVTELNGDVYVLSEGIWHRREVFGRGLPSIDDITKLTGYETREPFAQAIP